MSPKFPGEAMSALLLLLLILLILLLMLLHDYNCTQPRGAAGNLSAETKKENKEM